MSARKLIPTFFIYLTCFAGSASLTGCASLLQGAPDDDWDSTRMSQSAPEARDPIDMSSDEYRRERVAPAIENRDIVPGMSPQDVISAWGRPRDIEVAGDGTHGNERWVYYSGNSLRYGISQPRVIYFENGRVAGWESGR